MGEIQELKARARMMFVLSTVGYALVLAGVVSVLAVAAGEPGMIALAPIAASLPLLLRRGPM